MLYTTDCMTNMFILCFHGFKIARFNEDMLKHLKNPADLCLLSRDELFLQLHSLTTFTAIRKEADYTTDKTQNWPQTSSMTHVYLNRSGPTASLLQITNMSLWQNRLQNFIMVYCYFYFFYYYGWETKLNVKAFSKKKKKEKFHSLKSWCT